MITSDANADLENAWVLKDELEERREL